MINESGTVLNEKLKAEMPKIDTTVAGWINGLGCLITGNANKTECVNKHEQQKK